MKSFVSFLSIVFISAIFTCVQLLVYMFSPSLANEPSVSAAELVKVAESIILKAIGVGILVGFYINLINSYDNQFESKTPMAIKSLLGMFLIYSVELLSSLIINHQPYLSWVLNIDGIITLITAPVWFLIIPILIGIDENYRICMNRKDKRKPRDLYEYYVDLFRFES